MNNFKYSSPTKKEKMHDPFFTFYFLLFTF
jgi:hypothetical protein